MKTPNGIFLKFLIFLGALANSHAQPVIIQQPQNQTNLAGADVSFSVEAAGTPPLNYQWRSYLSTTSFTDIAGANDLMLMVTNIQPTSQSFGVVVSDASGSVTSALARIFVAPTIIQQPAAQTLPDGSRTSFAVEAVSSAAPRYQWLFDGTPLVGQKGKTLDLYRVESEQAGAYSVVITNQYGSATSEVARLTVTVASSPFTRVKVGSIVNDLSISRAGAWGDYDGDGFIDLFVANGGIFVTGRTNSFLYHNNRDGTFTRVTNSPIELALGRCTGGAWGDFDNDGNLDLVTVQVLDTLTGTNHLFRGAGGGAFVEVSDGPLRLDFGASRSVSWVDSDDDGYLDIFRTMYSEPHNKLYHNNHDVTFAKVTQGSLVTDMGPVNGGGPLGATWGDYNNDGRPDLFVAMAHFTRSRLYRNDGLGVFTRVDDRTFNAGGPDPTWNNGAWGDYDNDGDLDLFVSSESGVNTNGWPNVLLRNDGTNGFTVVTNLPANDPENQGGASWGCQWADYDNDGWLDLFVANANVTHNNFLYHNNGDGTFTKVTSGSIVNDGATCMSAAWGDYDNDGFLDLFVGTGFNQPEKNLLYHNNGNANHWIKFRLVGTRSNRSAIGAKVRLHTTINGRDFWQMREVSGGDGYMGQNDMRPNFGLGDATHADTVRIEWPSGTVQELHNVAANQILTVTEPALLEPTLTLANGVVELKVNSWPGFTYEIEATSDLQNWTSLGSVTNLTGALQLPDGGAQDAAQRFYRAVQR